MSPRKEEKEPNHATAIALLPLRLRRRRNPPMTPAAHAGREAKLPPISTAAVVLSRRRMKTGEENAVAVCEERGTHQAATSRCFFAGGPRRRPPLQGSTAEGAMPPPQLPAPATHAEVCIRLQR
nr:hypothetical protein Itr_chr12CG16020 [Ipomoea trifida]